MPSIVLKPTREKSVLSHHPWIFSGAIASVEGDPQSGETVDIVGADGSRLGRGGYSPHSQIRVRVWTFDPDEEVKPDLFRVRLQRAIQSRQPGFARTDQAFRLVHSESDGFPGLIVDRYGEFLVCQFLSAGTEYWRHTIVAQLQELIFARGIYERSDVDVREKEGLPKRAGVLSGKEPPDLIEIQEDPCRFFVDVKRGQKTGFYLDQRDNRACLAQYTEGADVLNCFAYTGSFGLMALKAGATQLVNVESSSEALSLANRNIELNRFDRERVQNVEGDVFEILRRYRDSGRQFDVIILDPPRFVLSLNQLKRASRGYKDINLLAFKLIRPSGILFTFSCSGLMDRALFQKIVADAALDAGRDVQVIRWLSQAPDHPSGLNFPQGSYLKGLVCRVWG